MTTGAAVKTENGIDEAALRSAVADLAAPLVAAEDAELDGVELKGQRGSRLVRVVVDRPGGIDVDLITRLSRQIGAVLEERDVVDGRYTLEVSSPGATRPLRTGRDFHRNEGRDVRLDRTGQPELIGTIVAADDDTLTLEVDGDTVTVPLADIDHGRVILPW